MKKTLLVSCLLLSGLAQADFVKDDVVLQRNGITVTVEDVERYIAESTPEKDRNLILSRKDVYQEISENIYIVRSLSKEAAANKQVQIDEDQLRWAQVFNRDRRMMSALFDVLVAAELKKIDWDKMAKEAYLAEKEKYRQAPTVSASHILIKTEGRTEQDALALAKTVRAKANADNFAELAQEYSEDPTAKANKGDLGYFSRGRMVKPFEEKAFAMKAGDISQPVKSQFGYHIILLKDKKPESYRSFESVKAGLTEQLRQSVANKVTQAKVLEYKTAQDIELNKAILEQMKEQRLGYN